MLSDFTDIDDILGERMVTATIKLNYCAPRCAGLTGREEIAGKDIIPNTTNFDAPLWVIPSLYGEFSPQYYNNMSKDINSANSRFFAVNPLSTIRLQRIHLIDGSPANRLATDLATTTNAKYINFSGLRGTFLYGAPKLVELLLSVVMKHHFGFNDSDELNARSDLYDQEDGIFEHGNIITLARLATRLGDALLTLTGDRLGEWVRKAATAKDDYLIPEKHSELLSIDEWALIDEVIRTCALRSDWMSMMQSFTKMRRQ